MNFFIILLLVSVINSCKYYYLLAISDVQYFHLAFYVIRKCINTMHITKCQRLSPDISLYNTFSMWLPCTTGWIVYIRQSYHDNIMHMIHRSSNYRSDPFKNKDIITIYVVQQLNITFNFNVSFFVFNRQYFGDIFQRMLVRAWPRHVLYTHHLAISLHDKGSYDYLHHTWGNTFNRQVYNKENCDTLPHISPCNSQQIKMTLVG